MKRSIRSGRKQDGLAGASQARADALPAARGTEGASWIAAWLLLCFQLGTLGFFSDARAGAIAQTLLLGLALVAALAARAPEAALRPRRAAALAASAAAFALAVPWPFAAGGALLAAGLALSPWRAAARAAGALARTGLALACGAALAGLYAWFAPAWHEVPAATPLLGWLLERLGFAGAVSGTRWVSPDADIVHRFTPTVEGFALLPALLLLSAGLALRGSAGALRPARLALLLAAALVYLPLRYALVYAWVDASRTLAPLTDPTATALSFLPLAALLALADPRGRAPRGLPRAALARFRPASFAAAGLAWACAWIALLDPDPGVIKPGRVWIDETHSEWERTDDRMDAETYGERSTYNYSGLAAWLGQHYDVGIAEEGLTPELLAGCDVLVLKTPTSPYAPEEIDAIHAYVRRGGGLFVIGDHTNVFGSSTFLDEVVGEYGIRFEADATYAHDGGLSLYEAPSVARHPAVLHLPPFLFATSCSLRGSPALQPIQTGTALQTMPADYGRRSFFAEGEDWLHRPFGLFHQTVGARAGRGRVVAFSDSTVWSNFFLHVRGKPELLLGLVDWCNRANAFPHLRPAAAGLALALLLAAWSLSRAGGAGARLADVLVFPGLLASALALPAIDAWNRRSHPPVRPHGELAEVRFLLDGADVFLPAVRLIDHEHPGYLNFFNWTQRVGLVPVMATNAIAEADAGPEDVLALLRDRRPLGADEAELLARRVEAGGSVLVLQDRTGLERVAPLLARFGVRWTSVPAAAPPDVAAATEAATLLAGAPALTLEARSGERALPALAPALAAGERIHLEGGAPWLRAADGVCQGVLCTSPSGGRLLVLGLADAFTNERMGVSSVVPTAEQRELFELEYEIWRALAPDRAL